MMERTRERIAAVLAGHDSAVLCVRDGTQVILTPLRYVSDGLDLTGELPAWRDGLFFLEQHPQVMLIVPSGPDAGYCVRYQGDAALDPGAGRTGYRTVRIRPRRIDVLDPQVDWAICETFEQ